MILKKILYSSIGCQTLGHQLVRLIVILLFLYMHIPVFAQSADTPSIYDEAVEAFMYNKPQEAIPLFEASLRTNSTNSQAYLFLGMAYEQIGLYDQAIGVLQDGAQKSSQDKHLMYFNLGNISVRQGNYDRAMEFFNRSIDYQRSYSPSYLNRGNNRVRTEDYAGAIEDYRSFIQLSPRDEKVPRVLEMIAALEGEIQARERQRIAEQERQKLEEAQRQEEQERIAREQVQQARQEEQRRQALLSSVFNSLGNAADATNSLGAGAESVIDIDDEISIDD